jgi:hypothetical protein
MFEQQSVAPGERRWRGLLEKNIGWVVVAASIWLTHFLK